MPNQAVRKRQPTDLCLNCVVLPSFHSEFTFLRNVFGKTGIRMHYAESVDRTDFLLTVTDRTALLADVMFVDGFWQHSVFRDAAILKSCAVAPAAISLGQARGRRSISPRKQ
jgi:hypothetical protein